MIEFNKQLQDRLDKMCKTGKLFRSEMTGQEVWDLYLTSFEPDNDPMYRDPESSTHNCNFCKNFLRRYGNIVALDSNYNIITLFDEVNIEGYVRPAVALTAHLKAKKIEEVFLETYTELNSLPYESCKKDNNVFRLGMDKNIKRYTKEEAEKFGVVKPNETKQFDHMHINLPKNFVDTSGKSAASILSNFRDAKNVFQRAMVEIPVDTLILVRDLINQNSLLDGTTHLSKVEAMITLKSLYNSCSEEKKDNWCWMFSHNNHLAKFKNELIGVLCSELAEGKELNEACKAWNKRVDPANYMKATAPITTKQIEEAKKFVQENGYEESFNRRLANIDDIKASEIKYLNSGTGDLKEVSIFDSVKSTSTRHKRSEFDGVDTVSIEKFMSDILPSCTSVEAFLKNEHDGNMVTLTTANIPDSKPIFKWDNNYSWTFNGNLAGKSQLAQMVEAKGGRTDGVFRFTHSWNELEPNESLMDLHVFMPGNPHKPDGQHDHYGAGRRVGWNNRQDLPSGGNQDVDYTQRAPFGYVPVENITFPDLKRMPEGKYICKIHNWNFRQSGGKGKSEIAFAGNVYQYVYPATTHKEWITVAEVTLKDGKFSIDHKLPIGNEVSKEIYGLETNNFHKVNLVCLSPNHWGENAVGNKHYMFMLENCKTPSPIRSFHNENLSGELLEHRKVMEVLGSNNMTGPTINQLSGLGFNSTVSDELIVRLQGSHKRVVKIKF